MSTRKEQQQETNAKRNGIDPPADAPPAAAPPILEGAAISAKEADAAVDEERAGDGHTTASLSRRYAQAPQLYDGLLTVCRVGNEGVKRAPWVCDLPVGKLTEATKEIATKSGPGRYIIWMLESKTRQKIKGCYAELHVDADLRANRVDGGMDVAGGGMGGIITALAIALKPAKSEIETLLFQKMMGENTDQILQRRKDYDEGFTAGLERGKIMGGDSWKPGDVIALIREGRTLVGGLAASGGTRDVPILELFTLALDLALSPAQMCGIMGCYSGADALKSLYGRIETIIVQAQKDPEASKILGRDGAKEWVVAFSVELEKRAAA